MTEATCSDVPSRCSGTRFCKLLRFRLLGHLIVEPGADDAGRHAVDADIVIGKLPSQCSRELRHGSLDRLIGHVGPNAADAGRRRDEHDGPFLLGPHGGNGCPAKMKDRMHVNVEGIEPHFRRDVEQAAIDRAASRVDQHVDGAELLSRRGDARRCLVSLAAIRWHE